MSNFKRKNNANPKYENKLQNIQPCYTHFHSSNCDNYYTAINSITKMVYELPKIKSDSWASRFESRRMLAKKYKLLLKKIGFLTHHFYTTKLKKTKSD